MDCILSPFSWDNLNFAFWSFFEDDLREISCFQIMSLHVGDAFVNDDNSPGEEGTLDMGCNRAEGPVAASSGAVA